MATKITVNGVAYDSVDAMPPAARRIYDQAVARMPGLADRDGDGIPDIASGNGLSAVVRKRFVVNGVSYDDVSAMPADVRQQYEQAMRAMNSGGPGVSIRRNDVKFSFQVRRGSGAATAADASGAIGDMAKPIEPSIGGAARRIVLSVAGMMAAALALWLWERMR